MLPVVVLDTSVVVKWFRQEEVLAAEALAWRQAYVDGETTVVVPMLLVYEVANALQYKGDLTAKQVEEAIEGLFDLDLEWVRPSVVLMQRVVRLARAHKLTVYDATFVALAEMLHTPLITADDKLVRRVASDLVVHFAATIAPMPPPTWPGRGHRNPPRLTGEDSTVEIRYWRDTRR